MTAATRLPVAALERSEELALHSVAQRYEPLSAAPSR